MSAEVILQLLVAVSVVQIGQVGDAATQQLPPLVESYPPTAASIAGTYQCFGDSSVRVEVAWRDKAVMLVAVEGLGRVMTPADRKRVDTILSSLGDLSSVHVTCTGTGIVLDVTGRDRTTRRSGSVRVYWSEKGVRDLQFPPVPQR